MADYAPRVKKILAEAGCRFDKHGKGEHDHWYSPLTNRRVTVDHCIVSRHTANEVLKQSGLKKAF